MGVIAEGADAYLAAVAGAARAALKHLQILGPAASKNAPDHRSALA
jgi:hypothetical protein